MPPDTISLDNLTDRDLLIVAVTKINGLDEKVDEFASQVKADTNRLTILETEHKARIVAGECSLTQVSPKKAAGISGAIAVVVALVLDWILRRFGVG